MKLRTLTGQRWPAKCADGCGAEVPAGPDVKVVVDLESRPRKAWLPEHSPDAGTWNRRGGGNGGGSTSRTPAGPTPSPGSGSPPSPSPFPRGPSGDSAASEEEEAVGSSSTPHGSSASASASPARPFSSGWITVSGLRSAGAESKSLGSVHVEISDEARPGEPLPSLASRLNAALETDLQAKVRLLVRAHQELQIELSPPVTLGGRGARA